MINDLNLIDTEQISIDTQLCIIGAGTAGLFLGHRLRSLGVRVLNLEAGSLVSQTPQALGQQCFQMGMPYRGSDVGRSFGLGGTSVLWGGQLIPVSPSDMANRFLPELDAWPVTYDEIFPYFSKVKQNFGLSCNTSSDDLALIQNKFPDLANLSPEFKLRLSEWLPFKTRNFSRAFSSEIETDPEWNIWINAEVLDLLHSSNSGRNFITKVKAVSKTGKQLEVKAETFVISAGTLESTRILLEFDEASDGLISRNGSPLGRYFADHISATCGKLTCHDWRSYNLATAPIFSSGVMRSPRLELTSSAQKKLNTYSAFAHLPFVTRGNTGFDVVRSFLRKRQGEQIKVGIASTGIAKVVSDISSIMFWRGVHRRLWIPQDADLFLQVDAEQVPNWDSRLFLSDVIDTHGRKRLAIDWRIKQEDIDLLGTTANLIRDSWEVSLLGKVAELDLNLPNLTNNFEALYDVYHPTGTLRMGSSPKTSVVDQNLKLWAIENCFVSSTAVFPFPGSANPGLTHLALTTRLADYIAQLTVKRRIDLVSP